MTSPKVQRDNKQSQEKKKNRNQRKETKNKMLKLILI